jgi:hypothetical protein
MDSNSSNGGFEGDQNFSPEQSFQNSSYQTGYQSDGGAGYRSDPLPGNQSDSPSGYPMEPPPPAPVPAPASAITGDAGAGNIDKIRDILFGSNMREYEQRFARLEEALKKESLELRENTRRHLEALEGFVHKEFAALETRLNAEHDERSDSHSRLAGDLAATSNSIWRKIGEVENQESQAKREIRNDLLQQSKELTDAIRAKGEEVIELLERRAQELHHGKTDRTALAGLFNEMALRLSDPFKVSGAE